MASSWTKRRRLGLAAVAAVAATGALAQAPGEAPGNQVLYGSWINEESGYSDTFIGVNARLGFNVPVFQIAQAIPLPPFDWVTGAGGLPPEPLIEQTGTDAAVFLTVYPVNGLQAVAQADLDALAIQLDGYITTYNRTVFLRFAPEMNGIWNKYGNQPTGYRILWDQMYTTMKTKNPGIIIVWAPNMGDGYPWGQTLPTAQDTPGSPASQFPEQDGLALDTNGNNRLDNGDDPYLPYFPGYNGTDWLGISIYYKGVNGGNDVDNAVMPHTGQGFCSQVFSGVDPIQGGAATYPNFYTVYCENSTTHACMMSESGAAWHTESPAAGTSQVEIQTAWINDCIANPAWFAAMPRIKMIMQFEQEKRESGANSASGTDLRDFRLTNDTAVKAVLQAALSSVGPLYSWANPRAIPTSLPNPGQSAASGSHISTPPAVVTATIRDRSPQIPLLFGNKHVVGGGVLKEVIELSVVVTCGIVGMLAVMRWL